MTETDLELLKRYTRGHAEEAFAEIVRRHLDLVYSAALRQVRSPQLAEEVAQSAFTDLARSANRLAPNTIVSAWLYQVAHRTAIDVVRRESRRQLREQIATEMNAMNATNADWMQIEPILDEAMQALDETDRAAVLLRYFENKSLREVGHALATSDDAAQKRVSRAIERLREYFAKRGVTVGTSGLAVVISANAVQSAPVGMAVAISASAFLAGAAITTTGSAMAAQAVVMTALQKGIIGGILAVAVAAGIYEARQTARLRVEVRNLRDQQMPLSERLANLTAENDRLSNLVAQAQNLDGEQSTLGDSAGTLQARRVASGVFAQTDLELRLREAMKLPDGERQSRLHEIARSIAILEMPAAMTLAESVLTAHPDRLLFQETMMMHWAERDPGAALDFVLTYTPGTVHTVTTGGSPESASAHTPGNGNADDRQKFVANILQSWASKDPLAALAWVEKRPDGMEKQNCYAIILTALAGSDPQQAVVKLIEMPAGRTRDNLLQRIAAGLGDEDPRSAAEFGKLLPAGSSRDQFLQQLAAVWIGKDPKAAVNFILELSASGSRDELMRKAVCAWARTDPDSAAKFSETLPFNRMWSMTGVAYNWTVSDPAAAWQWSLTIADDETRRSALGGVLRCLATTSKLNDAAQYASQIAGDDQVRAVRSLLIDSSELDPDWTSRWVATFPAGETRNQAVEKLVQHWAESDPIATANWLAAQPRDQAFQEGARRLVPGMLKASPAVAWDWAMVLTDPAAKEERLAIVAKSWLASDTEAARKKILASGLPADQMSKLLEQRQ